LHRKSDKLESRSYRFSQIQSKPWQVCRSYLSVSLSVSLFRSGVHHFQQGVQSRCLSQGDGCRQARYLVQSIRRVWAPSDLSRHGGSPHPPFLTTTRYFVLRWQRSRRISSTSITGTLISRPLVTVLRAILSALSFFFLRRPCCRHICESSCQPSLLSPCSPSRQIYFRFKGVVAAIIITAINTALPLLIKIISQKSVGLLPLSLCLF
jgi:hypothetical protein